MTTAEQDFDVVVGIVAHKGPTLLDAMAEVVERLNRCDHRRPTVDRSTSGNAGELILLVWSREVDHWQHSDTRY